MFYQHRVMERQHRSFAREDNIRQHIVFMITVSPFMMFFKFGVIIIPTTYYVNRLVLICLFAY